MWLDASPPPLRLSSNLSAFPVLHSLGVSGVEAYGFGFGGVYVQVDKILAYKCDVFINRQLIYNYPDQLFKAAGVAAIEHSDFDGMERLAAALGAEILSTFDSPSEVRFF